MVELKIQNVGFGGEGKPENPPPPQKKTLKVKPENYAKDKLNPHLAPTQLILYAHLINRRLLDLNNFYFIFGQTKV